MRELWRAVALMASDNNFTARVQKLAGSVDRPELKIPDDVYAKLPPGLQAETRDLSKQPDFTAVSAIRDEFVKQGISLAAYEACEVNRWLYEDRNINNGGMKPLHDAWSAVGNLGTTLQSDPDHMALFGALTLDKNFRFDFTENNAPLSTIGFTVPATLESQLRDSVRVNSVADVAMRTLDATSWSGSCGGIALAAAGWIHVNT